RCDATIGNAHWTQLRVVDTDLSRGGDLTSLVVKLKDASTSQVLVTEDMVGTTGSLDLSGIDANAHPALVLDASSTSATGDLPWADGVPPRVVVSWSADPAAGCFDTTTTADCAQASPTQLSVDATSDDSAPPVNAHVQLLPPSCALALNALAGISATEGVVFSGQVGTLSVRDPTVLAGAFDALISWGDGATSPGVVTGGN